MRNQPEKRGIKRKRKIYPESATDWEIQIW
jgi:hypothetical protein